MELYAGAANVWRAVSQSYPAVRADLTYASTSQPEFKQNPMDVLTSAGFAIPSCILMVMICESCLQCALILIQIKRSSKGYMYCKLCFLFNTNCKRLQTTIRICIWLVLQCRHADFFGLLAIVCSSWVPINIATSKRSVALPEGNTALSYVANANCMCSRFLGLQFCVRSVD